MLQEIKKLAKELGFDQVGVTRPQALEEGEQAIRKWVAEGKHGSMKYLEDFESRRERFYRDFPDAKRVIVLGVNYYQGHQDTMSPSHTLSGRVARYAWGKDYHKVIREMHEKFMARLQEMTDGVRAVSCIDTQPLPERYAAQKAGLGFLGKHTGLLSREFGPWLFLSEIITNLEIEEDIPAAGDCGTCDHCQTACPTGALNQDYEMDARLCIAYLTIEHKGVIPRELRPKIKDWIFGCDICLAVCPFTSKSIPRRGAEFALEGGAGEWLAMDELFGMRSNREYEKRFADTAISRTTRKQMLRNACVVLGNSGRPEALPYLKKALEEVSPLVRLHAAWALGRLESDAARQVLDDHVPRETDAEVLSEMRLARQKSDCIV